MSVFLDTDVLVDCLRGTLSAGEWLQKNAGSQFLVPSVAAMELIAGCRNQEDIKAVQRFLARFEIAWPDPEEMELAMRLLIANRLSNNMSIPDCIIAVSAVARGATLFTFNAKRYWVIEGLTAEAPYDR